MNDYIYRELWQGKDYEQTERCVKRCYFRLCHFKGGSSTTVNNTSTYTPTEYELAMQKNASEYAKAVSPNALALNNYAMNVLRDSLGTVQVDYNGMNQQAQRQIANATNGMSGLIGSNNAATNAANGTLSGLAGQYTSAANKANSVLGNAANATSAATNAANNALGTYANRAGSLAGTYTGANNTANAALQGAGSTLSSLASGNLPTAYQQNMENAISSALTNTMGKTLTNLGNRGVLNSSVTNTALNDIQKNAANSVAQQYQQNINQVAGLTNQGAQFAQQQYGNTTNTANALNNLYNQQANAAQQQYKNTAADAQNQASTAQQQLSNTANVLGQQGNIAQQQLSNTQGNNSQASGLYSNLLNSAAQPIATAAAAQEAAQQPAANLWNMSLGLNQGGSISALQTAAGKGTTTSTQTQSTSGGGMGGLFGGLFSGIGYGLGNAWCFPAGTMVKMADGTEKEIQRIEKGEEVLTDSGKAEKVIETMPPHYNDVYNIIAQHGHTSTTLTQPLMKPDGTYVLAGDLRIGTELKNVGKVQSIVYSGERRVYDLHVAGENNYIADGFTAQGGEDWPE